MNKYILSTVFAVLLSLVVGVSGVYARAPQIQATIPTVTPVPAARPTISTIQSLSTTNVGTVVVGQKTMIHGTGLSGPLTIKIEFRHTGFPTRPQSRNNIGTIASRNIIVEPASPVISYRTVKTVGASNWFASFTMPKSPFVASTHQTVSITLTNTLGVPSNAYTVKIAAQTTPPPAPRAVISSIQSATNSTGTIDSGREAGIYGSGLSGPLTVEIGGSPGAGIPFGRRIHTIQYIKIVGTSNAYAKFMVPTFQYPEIVNITVTNASGVKSNAYSVRINVPVTPTQQVPTAIIRLIQAPAAATDTLYTGEKDTIFGSGLSGPLTISIGFMVTPVSSYRPTDPLITYRTVKVNGTVNSEVNFILPQSPFGTSPHQTAAITVTNSSGIKSNAYTVKISGSTVPPTSAAAVISNIRAVPVASGTSLVMNQVGTIYNGQKALITGTGLSGPLTIEFTSNGVSQQSIAWHKDTVKTVGASNTSAVFTVPMPDGYKKANITVTNSSGVKSNTYVMNVAAAVPVHHAAVVINSVHSQGDAVGTVTQDKKTIISGTGLSGSLTIRIGFAVSGLAGSILPAKYQIIKIVSESNTLAEFVMPRSPYASNKHQLTSIRITNAFYVRSNEYALKIDNGVVAPTVRPAVINHIQSQGDAVGTVTLGQKTTIHGIGLSGPLTVNIMFPMEIIPSAGLINTDIGEGGPVYKTVKTTGLANQYAYMNFVMPKGPLSRTSYVRPTGKALITVTNSSGMLSNVYTVKFVPSATAVINSIHSQNDTAGTVTPRQKTTIFGTKLSGPLTVSIGFMVAPVGSYKPVDPLIIYRTVKAVNNAYQDEYLHFVMPQSPFGTKPNQSAVITVTNSSGVKSNSYTVKIAKEQTSVISSISTIGIYQMKVVYAERRAVIYGSWLSGPLTIDIGFKMAGPAGSTLPIKLQTVKAVGSSVSSVAFTMPQSPFGTKLGQTASITITNASGVKSNSYTVKIAGTSYLPPILRKAVINYIQSQGDVVGTVTLGQKTTVAGTGLDGPLTVSIGFMVAPVGSYRPIDPLIVYRTIKTTSPSDNAFNLVMPQSPFGTKPNQSAVITVTNSSGVKSKAYTVKFGGFTAPAPVLFTRNMWRGMHGNDVKKLQQVFNSTQEFRLAESGPGSPGHETTYFGFLLQAAVQNFQCKYDIVCSGTEDSTGYGVVGPKTRTKLNVVFGNGATTASAATATSAATTASTNSTNLTHQTVQTHKTTQTTSSLQQKIHQALQQLEIMQKQLKTLQAAMVSSAFGM